MYVKANLENQISILSTCFTNWTSIQEEKRKISEVHFLFSLNHGLNWVFGQIIFKATVGYSMQMWGFEDWKQF